ncbi:mitogen-activated protein kinase kinase kinase 1-like [Macadamia integrifolia]|uniref:mitogen-activated protein kinase kinase kinase 1-like n=1 Tax=Macadamia integrifolia TaxID=60698 RepID=UPI001C4F10D3|nr:mitogen-activated protein kinase kinase kinase 1-like [Macadamia integrifolia]
MRMDDSSVPSDSNPPPPGHQTPSPFKPFETPIANRIARAFHYLRLLHRSDANFAVLGASGNVYTVTLSTTPSCTCPDRMIPCKHILFVYLRVLGVSLNDTCLQATTLRPGQVSNLLVSTTLPDSLAGVRVRERYLRLMMSQSTTSGVLSREAEVEEGATCPICLEEMKREDRVVACGSCRNSLHEECLQKWKRIKRRSTATCVICRERWRDNNGEQDRYLNLAAYLSDDDEVEAR